MPIALQKTSAWKLPAKRKYFKAFYVLAENKCKNSTMVKLMQQNFEEDIAKKTILKKIALAIVTPM